MLLTIAGAHGQGGLGAIGQNMETGDEFDDDLPLTVTLGVGTGWDSNTNTSSTLENESAYINGGIGAIYGIGDKTTQLNLGTNFGAIYYFDQAPGVDDDFYNARISLDLVHRASPRLTLIDNAYFTYEIEPDYAIGASTARRNDQYSYFYNRFAASYAWSRRLSTVTSYTISGIFYEEDIIAATEDRLTHNVGNQFRYAWTRQTTLTADYRYQRTNFDTLPRDINEHFVLAGIDHRFTRATSLTASGGAQFYDDSVSGSSTKPYGELALNYRVTEDTTVRWANRVGLESNEVAGFNDRYTWRSGLSANHRLTPYLTGSGGISYVLSRFDGGTVTSDLDEDAISVNAGLSFRVLPNTDLDARYYFTKYSSDNSLRDYDRHRVSLGLSTTF